MMIHEHLFFLKTFDFSVMILFCDLDEKESIDTSDAKLTRRRTRDKRSFTAVSNILNRSIAESLFECYP
jgi:hypothetical protein